MEDGTGGEKEDEAEECPTLPDGFIPETIERAVEAARFGVDTLLLTPGGERTRHRVEKYIASIATDAKLVSQSPPIWRWDGAGKLVISDTVDKGRSAYRRLHLGMTNEQAHAALEIVSARKS